MEDVAVERAQTHPIPARNIPYVFPLFDLPAEIRLEIYRWVLSRPCKISITIHHIEDTGILDKPHLRSQWHSIAAHRLGPWPVSLCGQFLRTCKYICSEATSILYQENDFHITQYSDLIEMERYSPSDIPFSKSNAAYVRSLRLTFMQNRYFGEHRTAAQWWRGILNIDRTLTLEYPNLNALDLKLVDTRGWLTIVSEGYLDLWALALTGERHESKERRVERCKAWICGIGRPHHKLNLQLHYAEERSISQFDEAIYQFFDVAEAFEEAVRLTRMEERVVDEPESSESGSRR